MQTQTRNDKLALAMFVVLLLSYVVNAMDRQLFSVLATDVRTALNMDLPTIGLASTIFTLGMGLAGLPTGYLMARMKRKSVVLIGLVMFSVATYMTAKATGFADLLVYRFISGLGEAMQLTALLAIGTTYFYRHRAVAASSLNFTFGVGAILGPNIGAAIAKQYGWETSFYAFGLAGIPSFILIILFARAWFTEAKSTVAQAQQEVTNEGAATSIFSFRPMVLAAATAFSGLAIYGYLGLYPTFLRESLGLTGREAGGLISFYGLGALLSLLGGWLGDKFNYRKLLFVSLIISAVAGGFLFTPLGGSKVLHGLFSFVFGASISGMVYANLSAGLVKSVSSDKASLASGLFVASLYIPAAFAGYILGHLKGVVGWTTGGVIQLTGCALLAAILSLISAPRAKS